VDVGADRDRAFLVGGIDHAEQRFGGVGGDREQADVIDYDQIDADQLPDRLLMLSSARGRRNSCASVSGVSHATVRPLSIA
jgi:hypothetical protein